MNWLDLLQTKCEQLSRKQVISDLGISKTTLSQLLNNKYPGDLAAMEQKVTTKYGGLTVNCPVLGEIALSRCATEQNKPFNTSSPQRVKLFKACQSCIHRQSK